MPKKLRIGLNIVLALIAAVGVGVLLNQQLRWRDSAQAQAKAEQTAKLVPRAATALPAEHTEPGAAEQSEQPEQDPVVQALAEMDLAALREVNPDVVGWLYIPGTEISQPVLQGPDNDYYLRHTWEKKWNGGGAIFLDWRSSQGFEDFNTIIYGHQMNNGTMFAPLHLYGEPDFWQDYPSVYVALEDSVYRYDVFAVWEPSVTSMVYTVDFDTLEKRQAFLELCLASSQINTGVVPDLEDRLLTLSTCSGNDHTVRWVVQARLAQTTCVKDEAGS